MNKYTIDKCTINYYAVKKYTRDKCAINKYTIDKCAINEYAVNEFTIDKFAVNDYAQPAGWCSRHQYFCVSISCQFFNLFLL